MSNMESLPQLEAPVESGQQRRLQLVGGAASAAVNSVATVEWSDNHPYSSPSPAEIPLDPDYLPDYGM